LKRNFVFMTTDFVALKVSSRLIPELQSRAPRVTLQFRTFSSKGLGEALASGDADFAILPVNVGEALSQDIQSTPLYVDEFVGLVRPAHPLAQVRHPCPQDLAGQSFVTFHNGAAAWSEREQSLVAGYQPDGHIVAHVQHLMLLPLLAASTDVVAIAPRASLRTSQRSPS
jgi:DNA-binding transcriptional LysR family regulator